MRAFGYCVKSAKQAVHTAVGVEPVTSPPVTAGSFIPKMLEGHDLIYIRLHGDPNLPHWYNDQWDAAITMSDIEAADLGGAVVVVASCYGAGDPKVAALYRAGASVVVAGEGINWGGVYAIGTDLLTLWIRRGMTWGLEIREALLLAKARLALTAWRQADRDAMAFRIMEVRT